MKPWCATLLLAYEASAALLGDRISYLAYGSNLHPAVFERRRGIKPLAMSPAVAPGWRLAFDLRGGGATLVDEDADGYIVSLPASRVETYVPFYPLNAQTPAPVLRHAIALVWPEPLPLERVAVPPVAKGSMLPLLYGDDTLTVGGAKIPISDPTYAVVPRDKIFVGNACYFGGVSTMALSFLAAHPQMISPFCLLGVPVGFLSMMVGANWTHVWRALPPERPREVCHVVE